MNIEMISYADAMSDVPIPSRKKPIAYCNSEICITKHYPEGVRVRYWEKVKKAVRPRAISCPDCGSALFFERPK